MVHAKDGDYMEVELFEKPALFSNYRIDTVSVPMGLYCYDLRGSSDDPGMPIAVEPLVVVNHAGTVLTVEPIEFNDGPYRREFDEDNGLNFTGGHIRLKDFCEKHGIAYSETKYALRPASQDEAGLFYAMPPEKDLELGCIGHVRMDFGHQGKEFWHTWHPRGPEELNSPEFKAELQEVVDELRQTVLSDMVGMRRFCMDNDGYMDGGVVPNYGYIVESEKYRYCLRCIPMQGDYNAYLTCFDKRIPELRQAEQLEKDAQMAELLQKENLIMAYVYEGNSREEFMFDGTPENIANFLGCRPAVDSITLTDMLDRFVLDTFGNFINRCSDQNLLAQVVQALAPIQAGKEEAKPFFCPTIQQVEAYQEHLPNETMEMGGI